MVRFVSRRPRSSDDGFTLVELVVALTVLAIGIVGVIGVTNSSFRVAGTASARSKMVAIATREVESLRAIKYDQIQNGYLPPTTRTANGITYTLERTITQADDPIPNDGIPADNHKQVIVAVAWTDQAGPHEVREKSFLYPGGIGASNSATTTTVAGNCTPGAPGSLNVNQVFDWVNGVLSLQYTNSLDVSWQAGSGCAPASYVIWYKPSTSSTYTELNKLVTSTSYRVTGLAAGTTYNFQIFAKGPGGNLSSGSTVMSGATGASIGSACAFGPITVTPSGVNKRSNADSSALDVTTDPIVRLPYNGTCANYDIVYKKTTFGAATTRQMDLNSAAGAYTAPVDRSGPWDVGVRYIDVVERTSRTKVGSVLFTVCEHNARTCG